MRAWRSDRSARAVAALAVGLFVTVATGSAGAAELAGRLVRMSGPVEVRPLGEPVWRAAAAGVVVQPGDMVRTGPGGAAEVALVHGVLRMDENTVIILPPPRPVPAAAGQPAALQLLLYRGRALFQILRERLQGTFDVITPSVIVGVKGTTFGVEQRVTVGVVVFDGSVHVAPAGRAGAPPVTVAAGQFTVLVQGRLAAPQPFQPGAPGAIWRGAPASTESTPLPSASTLAPPAPPTAPLPGAAAASAGLAAISPVPALAPAASPPPPVTTVALPGPGQTPGVQPPRLATVGGPPGSSGRIVRATVANVSDDAQAALQKDDGAQANDRNQRGKRGRGRRGHKH